jgi:hypothetical protein
MTDDEMTLAQAAVIIGVSQVWLRKLCEAKKLQCRKIQLTEKKHYYVINKHAVEEMRVSRLKANNPANFG